MDFLSDALQEYVEQHSSPETPLLQKINRETNSQVLMPRMLSGHLQGRVLSFFSKMIRPTQILEIGTYTGYSAICLAEGLQEGGTLTTIDINEELEDRVREYFREAGLEDRINFVIGDARKVVAALDILFDLVFIDADKQSYTQYFELVIDRVRKGGFIVVDNVLWSGKVSEDHQDKDTENMRRFNEMIRNDRRVENVLLPIRDGLMVIQKI